MNPRNRDKRTKDDRPHTAPKRDSSEAPSSVIYGLLPVIEALRASSRRIDKVLLADGMRGAKLSEVIDLCRTNSIPWSRVPRDAVAKLIPQGANHQGVVAFTASASYVDADEIVPVGATALLLLLDGVEDPRNLGAVLRAAECAGIDGVVIPERRAVGLTETVAKSSAGAIEHVKVAKVANLNRYIEQLKKKDIWVVGTSVSTDMDYTQWDWTRPTALVLGSEGSGLHRLVAENCDALVKIPMYGKIDSLNVSVAAGVLLFEARRQRSATGD
jgi:23S rRNA (guanosine2251-2'-O)-methyltransferase